MAQKIHALIDQLPYSHITYTLQSTDATKAYQPQVMMRPHHYHQTGT